MQRKIATLGSVLVVTVAAHAQAQPGDGAAPSEGRRRCDDTYDKVQDVRDHAADGSDLLQGLEDTKSCLADECAEATRKNCVENRAWFEREIPYVVFTASKDGKAIVPDRITVDDKPADRSNASWQADGRKRRVNPGRHVFVFTAGAENVTVERTVHQATTETVDATFAAAAPATTSIPSPPPTAPALDEPPRGSETDATVASGSRSTLRTAGFIALGGGGVGLVIGAIFGLRASSKLDDSKKDPNGAGCDAKDFCGAVGKAARQDAQSAGTISTIGFIAGAVLVVSGIALIVSAPSGTKATARVAPWVGLGAGGVTLAGGF